jgi:preprotein translocase subunit SecE
MSKLQTAMDGVKVFATEVVNEARKTTWPERQELIESTLVVIVSVVLLSVFVGVSDKILVKLLELLISRGR